jgi:membrane associated rhomboid family serine protease
MQIDQKPEDYRVQRADGSWTQRVNKPLCRRLSLIGAGFLVWMGASFAQSGGDPLTAAFFALFGFLIGGLFTLSLKSIDW